MPARKPVPRFKTREPQRPYQPEFHIPSFLTEFVHRGLNRSGPCHDKLRSAYLAVLSDKHVIGPWTRLLVEPAFNRLVRHKHLIGEVAFYKVPTANSAPILLFFHI